MEKVVELNEVSIFGVPIANTKIINDNVIRFGGESRGGGEHITSVSGSIDTSLDVCELNISKGPKGKEIVTTLEILLGNNSQERGNLRAFEVKTPYGSIHVNSNSLVGELNALVEKVKPTETKSDASSKLFRPLK